MRSGNHHTNPRGSHPKGSVLFYRLGSVVSGTQWHRGPITGMCTPVSLGAPICHRKYGIDLHGKWQGVAQPGSAISLTGANLLLASMDFNPQGGRHVTESRSAGCRAGLAIETNSGLNKIGIDSIATKQAISTNPQNQVQHARSDPSEQREYFKKGKYYVAGHRHCTTSLVIEQTSPNAGLVD
jgi:hypothetical protein